MVVVGEFQGGEIEAVGNPLGKGGVAKGVLVGGGKGGKCPNCMGMKVEGGRREMCDGDACVG